MSSLFIIGNGFDMAHGIPTAYKEFRKWLIDCYPDSLVYRETTIRIDDYAQLPVDEFAAEILVYAMDHASGEDWCNFEEALSRVNFFHKIPGPESEELDAIGYDPGEKMKLYLLYIDAISNAIIKSAEEYWPVFFGEWIKSVENKIEQGQYSPHAALIKLFSDPTNKYISFNYTKTLQQIYGVRVVKHIHNRVGQRLVFGHGDPRSEYSEPIDNLVRPPILSSFYNDFIQSLRKDTDKQMRKYKDFFNKLGVDTDKVYSYGFSYSHVDSPYIKEIIRRIAPNAIWFFTTYETLNKNELRKKKIKLRRYGFKGTFGCFDG